MSAPVAAQQPIPAIKPPRTVLPKFTDRLALGRRGLQVSPYCLGMTSTDETVSVAFDAGINFFFFTADMHWPLYEMTRRGLQKLLARGGGIRDQIVVAVVSYTPQPEFCSAPFMEALEAVPGLERVDVLVAGGSYAPELLNRLQVYQQHLEQGFLGNRAIGSTFHDRPASVQAYNHHLVDIAFIRYNTVHPGARYDVFPLLKKDSSVLLYNFKNVMGYAPPSFLQQMGLSRDHWFPQVTDHYKFILARPEFHGILCAPNTPEHVRALHDAIEENPLSEEEENYLINLGEVVQGRAVLAREDGSPS